MEVDLHIHSYESDGTDSPMEIVKRAKKNGVKVIALTDHDTIAGISECEKYAKEEGIELVKGIELSCSKNNTEIHILGYFLDLEDKNFIDELENLKKERDSRNEKIIEKFKNIGINIDIERLKKMSTGKILSRMHFANYLIEEKIVSTKQEAFAKYLGTDGKTYVPRENFPPERAVEILKKNGAFVSLAHPKLITLNNEVLENLIILLKKYGLDGIEAEYSSFSKDEKRFYKRLAKKHSLLVTGGSDYHGGNREGIDIGYSGIEYSVYQLIKDKKGSE